MRNSWNVWLQNSSKWDEIHVVDPILMQGTYLFVHLTCDLSVKKYPFTWHFMHLDKIITAWKESFENQYLIYKQIIFFFQQSI